MIYQFTLVNKFADKGIETVVVQGSSLRNILNYLMDYCKSMNRMDFYHNCNQQRIEDKANIVTSDLEPKCDS